MTILPRGSIVVATAERKAFRVDQAKLAMQSAIDEGSAMVVSRDRGFMVVLTRHDLTREVTGDGSDMLDTDDLETQDDKE